MDGPNPTIDLRKIRKNALTGEKFDVSHSCRPPLPSLPPGAAASQAINPLGFSS